MATKLEKKKSFLNPIGAKPHRFAISSVRKRLQEMKWRDSDTKFSCLCGQRGSRLEQQKAASPKAGVELNEKHKQDHQGGLSQKGNPWPINMGRSPWPHQSSGKCKSGPQCHTLSHPFNRKKMRKSDNTRHQGECRSPRLFYAVRGGATVYTAKVQQTRS